MQPKAEHIERSGQRLIWTQPSTMTDGSDTMLSPIVTGIVETRSSKSSFSHWLIEVSRLAQSAFGGFH